MPNWTAPRSTARPGRTGTTTLHRDESKRDLMSVCSSSDSAKPPTRKMCSTGLDCMSHEQWVAILVKVLLKKSRTNDASITTVDRPRILSVVPRRAL